MVACRSVEKAESAVEEIKKDTGNTNVTTYKLDLASLQSVRECAAEIIKHEERLDILINNAGKCKIQRFNFSYHLLKVPIAAI